MIDNEVDAAYEKVKRELSEFKDRMEFSRIERASSEYESLPYNCSFCGKDNNEVKTLIEGPSVYICNVCVRVCQSILDARGDK